MGAPEGVASDDVRLELRPPVGPLALPYGRARVGGVPVVGAGAVVDLSPDVPVVPLGPSSRVELFGWSLNPWGPSFFNEGPSPFPTRIVEESLVILPRLLRRKGTKRRRKGLSGTG